MRADRLAGADGDDRPNTLNTMCGRYDSTLPTELVARWFRTTNATPKMPQFEKGVPGADLLVVRFNPESRERSLDRLRFGLVPHWAKDPAIGTKIINARAESIAEKPSFREAFVKRRCLIPATAFYEWRKNSPRRQAYAIGLKGNGLFAFAGLWDGWRNPDGAWLRSFAIITTAANALLAPIHGRMPAIIAPEDYATWLGEQPAPLGELRALLRPFPAEHMTAAAVGSAPGKPTVRTSEELPLS